MNNIEYLLKVSIYLDESTMYAHVRKDALYPVITRVTHKMFGTPWCITFPEHIRKQVPTDELSYSEGLTSLITPSGPLYLTADEEAPIIHVLFKVSSKTYRDTKYRLEGTYKETSVSNMFSTVKTIEVNYSPLLNCTK